MVVLCVIVFCVEYEAGGRSWQVRQECEREKGEVYVCERQRDRETESNGVI